MSNPILHIVKPNLSTPLASSGSAAKPIKVLIQSPALLELVETIYQDTSDFDSTQTRAIGTLLGSRSDDGSEIEIRESYIVPHKEIDGDLIFEEAFHISTFQLFKRSQPELQVVGWFSTNPKLDLYTGLLQELYAKNSCAPHQPVLLTLEHKNEENKIISPIVNTYISSTVGLPANSGLAHNLGLDKIGSYAFIPVPNEIVYSKNELTTLKFISNASKSEDRTVSITGFDELKQLSSSIKKISDMLKILQDYSERVTKGEIKGDDKIGQSLLSNLNYKPSTVDVESLKATFEQHNNDTLLLEYLASCIKQQLDLSSKLTNFMLPEEALKL